MTRFEVESWVVMAGKVSYAERATREEAEKVVDEQYHLAAHFGLPVRVEARVIRLAGRFHVETQKGK